MFVSCFVFWLLNNVESSPGFLSEELFAEISFILLHRNGRAVSPRLNYSLSM